MGAGDAVCDGRLESVQRDGVGFKSNRDTALKLLYVKVIELVIVIFCLSLRLPSSYPSGCRLEAGNRDRTRRHGR